LFSSLQTQVATIKKSVAFHAASASVGQTHGLVVSLDGILYGSGQNSLCQFGTDRIPESKVFAKINQDVQEASAGPGYTLIIKKDGTLWGTNPNTCSWHKLQAGVKRVVAGDYFHLLLKNDGTLVSSGKSETRVLDSVESMDMGLWQNWLIVKNDATLWGTGENVAYQSRSKNSKEIGTNSLVFLLSNVKSASSGGMHSMALKNDGTLWGAGSNMYGQLGTGDNQDRETFVNILSNVSSVACAYNQTYALKNDGTLWATGGKGKVIAPSHNLDDDIDRNSFVPVLNDVLYISASWIRGATASSATAIKKDGTLWMIGANGFGGLGIGTYEDLEDWKSIYISIGPQK